MKSSGCRSRVPSGFGVGHPKAEPLTEDLPRPARRGATRHVPLSVMPPVVTGISRYAHGVLPYNIHHVAIAVEDLDAALDGFRTLYNVEPLSREVVEDQGVEEAMIAVGGSHIQILQATQADSPVGRFVERNGEGLHHIAFAVVDIDAALEHLRAEGARLIDEKPRRGGGGHKIAFVHPKETAGTLIELVEVAHE